MSDASAIPPLNEPLDNSGRAQAPAITLPLRFVWQSDEAGLVSGVSPELLAAMGPDIILNGRTWDDLILEHGLDSSGTLAQALARRETWSGVTVQWPLEDNLFLPVELAGLPVFDRDRTFRGFRGFGVVRAAPEPIIELMPEPDAEEDDAQPAPVLPFRIPHAGLNEEEHLAFREIARALNARTANDSAPREIKPPSGRLAVAAGDGALEILETLPAAILIHRLGTPLFANHAFLDLTGFEDLTAVIQHGLDALFEELPRHSGGTRGLGIRTAHGRSLRVEAHLKTISWHGEPASMLFFGAATAVRTAPENARERELRTILDTATDGVIVFDGNGRIVSVNRSAEALFGYEAAELEGRSFTLLLAADSHRAAFDYLEGLKTDGMAALMNDGREVMGVARRGGAVPLFMTFGRISDDSEPRYCAVMRDITQFKKAEEELRAAKLQAEHASAQKSDFLARISHEIRTPLNAILGFTEVMMEERFGPVGSDRYRQYLDDIHQSGNHIISLVNDLLDLAKIEAGRLDLNFQRVNLNEVAAAAVALLQPQANGSRIIIRTALTPRMPPVIADPRALKQIALNLLSNAVKYTPAGGQVIISTVVTELGHAVLRVRDTGVGMNEREIATALEPFRQLATTNPEGGTGLGLPLTKALVEANRASFVIQSAAGAGTLVEVVFPPDRVLGV
jgi:PAS domain S-box-containing protein